MDLASATPTPGMYGVEWSEINELTGPWDLKCVKIQHNMGFDILRIQVNFTLEWML